MSIILIVININCKKRKKKKLYIIIIIPSELCRSIFKAKCSLKEKKMIRKLN